jgi:uncharacterized protein (UPF0332 family)
MSFDWAKYIELADILHNKKTEESYRSAISRAYYGVFCLSRNIKGFKRYKKSNVHLKVIEVLRKSSNSNERLIGKLLDNLRIKRNNADYNDDKEIDEKISERSLLKAKKILEYFMLIQ